MYNRLIIITVMTAVLQVSGARAQEGNIQRDPFFPSAQGAVSSSDEWGRDPFGNPFAAGLHEDGTRSGGGALTGIIYGKDGSIAIIGGEALREGDMVGDRKLIEIRRSSVVLIGASGNREELFLENYSLGR